MHCRLTRACLGLAATIALAMMPAVAPAVVPAAAPAVALPPLTDDVPAAAAGDGDRATPRSRTAKAILGATGLEFAVVESYIRRHVISTDTPYGFKVCAVRAGSPAARAGIRPGDVLLTWDGRAIRRLRRLRAWIDAAPGDDAVDVTFARLRPDRSLLSCRPWSDHEARIRL